MRRALPFLAVSACLIAQAPAPTADEVLARAKAALGGAAWDRVKALRSQGLLHSSGLDGTLTILEDLTTGRQVNHYDLKVLRGANGCDGQAPWRQDGAGDVSVDESAGARKEFQVQRFDTVRGWWYPERAKAARTYRGLREEGGGRYHVVELLPEGGYPYELWIDAAEGTLFRTVATREGRTQTTTFSDYRVVDGIRLPFRVASGTGDPAFDTVIRLQAVEVNPSLAPGAFDRPRPDLGAYGMEGTTGRTEVPLESRHDHLLVLAMLNGKGPFRLFLDTGGANVLSPSAAKALGLDAKGSIKGGGVGEKEEAFALAQVDRVQIGGAWMGAQSFLVVPSLEGISEPMGVQIHGVVGYELFRRFVARIDQAPAKLTLWLPDRFTYQGPGVAVPFTFTEHQPQVEGELDGIPGRFDLDTGSGGTLDVYAPFAREHKLKEKAGRTIRTASGGAGGEVWGDTYRARELKLGGVAMREPLVTLADVKSGGFAKEGAAGNVGHGFLRRFDLVLDYPRKTIIFEKNAQWGEPDRFSATGTRMDPSMSGLIKAVYPGSAAEAAGLKAGETILSIDGRPFTALSKDDLRTFSRQPDGTRLRLKVRSGEAEREVVLVLKDVL